MSKTKHFEAEIQSAIFYQKLTDLPLIKKALKNKIRELEFVNRIILEKEHLLTEKNVEIAELEQKLIEARLDPVTKVLNRANIESRLYREISRPDRRKNDKFSIIMLDIDLFKTVNDTYGHNIGDIVLNKIAEICLEVAKSKRRMDIFGRWGGEEFLFVLPETDIGEALIFAERARKLIGSYDYYNLKKELSIPDSVPHKVTVSMGIAEQIEQSETIKTKTKAQEIKDHLIGIADKRLYNAKRSGRNRVCCSD